LVTRGVAVRVREYPFELRLCAHLERERGGIVSRQLGGGVVRPGTRIVDTVHVAPGPDFERRSKIGPRSIPTEAIEAEVGIGSFRPVTDVIDAPAERARSIAERAAAAGFFDLERRGGQTVVRQTVPYPEWYATLTAIENKPHLDSPGAMQRQLRFDTTLGLFDRVVLATTDHVTRAHLNRLPEAVGVWRFDPGAGDLHVVQSATALGGANPGAEIHAEHPLQTDVRMVAADAVADARRRVAERAWGRGWRPEQLPGCTNCEPTDAGLPHCTHFDRVVDHATECGVDCPGYTPGPVPQVDMDARRAARTAWDPDAGAFVSEQSQLGRFQPDDQRS
jgi:hypothetical protein